MSNNKIEDIILQTKNYREAIIVTVDNLEEYDNEDFITKQVGYISDDVSSGMKCFIVEKNNIVGYTTIETATNSVVILKNKITKIEKKPYKSFNGSRYLDINLIKHL